VSIRETLDGICRYFGGDYDPSRPAPTGPRRCPASASYAAAGPSDDDHADYFRARAPGARTGCQINVYIPRRQRDPLRARRRPRRPEERGHLRGADVPATSAPAPARRGRPGRRVRPAGRPEGVAAADRTLGGACFEAGEHIDGGMGSIDIEYGQPETSAELTKSFFLMTFPGPGDRQRLSPDRPPLTPLCFLVLRTGVPHARRSLPIRSRSALRPTRADPVPRPGQPTAPPCRRRPPRTTCPQGRLPAGAYEFVGPLPTQYLEVPLTARPETTRPGRHRRRACRPRPPATVFDWPFSAPGDGRWKPSKKKPNQQPDNAPANPEGE
jgi:hypothetical protein